jgi:hypothetical protein
MEDAIGAAIHGLIIFIIIVIAVFLILRAFWCWYLKIDHRVDELRKMNQTLSEIRALLIQGNTVGAITAGHVMDLSQTSFVENAATDDVYDDDIPAL